jgi:DNA-binding NarL/FixJ family response regulator
MTQILLVDDNIKVRMSLKSLLRNIENIQVIGELEDGNQVLPFIENHETELILMDINMKMTDGLTTTEKVKERFPNIKIIILSSYDHFAIRSVVDKSGADGFVSKFDATLDILKIEIEKVTNS